MLGKITQCLQSFTHRSAITLKPLTIDMNNMVVFQRTLYCNKSVHICV